MAEPRKAKAAKAGGNGQPTPSVGQIVLVLQGGGALGAYQAGVYAALHEAGIEPDWIIGTSIGAINASLIAGNAREERLAKLEDFWRRVTQQPGVEALAAWPLQAPTLTYWRTLLGGLPAFFEPNPLAFAGARLALGANRAGYYSTAPLERTLVDLVDFEVLNKGRPRLTVGAAHVRTSRMHYFDSREMRIDTRHVMASGALPPAFPAVAIDGEYYWDGGILSNTPTEAIFDDVPRRNSLIFAVHLWNAEGPVPETMWEVMHRHKDVQYSSRIASHITRQQQTHRLRHVIKELARYVPEALRKDEVCADLIDYGCLTRMHVVRLLAPRLDNEDHTKDVDFSADGIRRRWDAGYADTRQAIERAAWLDECDPLEGIILHEPGAPPAAVRESAGDTVRQAPEPAPSHLSLVV